MAVPRQPVQLVFCHVIRKESKAFRAPLPPGWRRHRRKPRLAWLDGDNPPCVRGIARPGGRHATISRCCKSPRYKNARMSAVELVQQCWKDLTARWGCTAPAAAAALDESDRAYREPHRHYHTLDHIAAGVARLPHRCQQRPRDAHPGDVSDVLYRSRTQTGAGWLPCARADLSHRAAARPVGSACASEPCGGDCRAVLTSRSGCWASRTFDSMDLTDRAPPPDS
jgi:hypothetical protein